MIIDEVLHHLLEVRDIAFPNPESPKHKAVGIGVEAVKAIQKRQREFPNLLHLMLPGQTKE